MTRLVWTLPDGQQTARWAEDAGGGGGGGSSTVTVPISAAQILDLRTTPVEIIPAPGVGFFTVVDWMRMILTPGTPYDTNTGLEVIYLDVVFNQDEKIIESTTFLALTDPEMMQGSTAASSLMRLHIYLPAVENVPVVVRALVGNPATGDGTISVYAEYHSVPV